MFWIGYRLFIRLLEFLVIVSSLWNQKSKKFLSARSKQTKRLEVWLKANDLPVIQIHCASLGEYELSLPLYEELKKSQPGYKFLFSFFSPSGYEYAKIPSGSEKAYIPIDRKKKVTEFLNLCNPSLVIFIKYEFWFQYLNQLKIRAIPFGYVNINQQQYPFNLKFKTAKSLVNNSAFIFSSNDKTSADLVSNQIRVDKKYLDLRYTKSIQLSKEKYEAFSELQEFLSKDIVIICGSVWKEDIEVLLPTIKAQSKIKWIVAPHKVDSKSINEIKKQLKPVSIFSEGKILEGTNKILVDTIGDLKYLYRYGALNYIGGAFKTGLHNVLEPISTGAPVVFGPNYHQFPEASVLIKEGLGFSIKNEKEFNVIIKKLLDGSLLLESSNKLEQLDSGLNEMTREISKYL